MNSAGADYRARGDEPQQRCTGSPPPYVWSIWDRAASPSVSQAVRVHPVVTGQAGWTIIRRVPFLHSTQASVIKYRCTCDLGLDCPLTAEPGPAASWLQRTRGNSPSSQQTRAWLRRAKRSILDLQHRPMACGPARPTCPHTIWTGLWEDGARRPSRLLGAGWPGPTGWRAVGWWG